MGHLVITHLTWAALSLSYLIVELSLYFCELRENLLHLLQEIRLSHDLLLFLVFAHFRDRRVVRVNGHAWGRLVHNASFLKLLQNFAMLVLDFYQSLDFFPSVGQFLDLATNCFRLLIKSILWLIVNFSGLTHCYSGLLVAIFRCTKIVVVPEALLMVRSIGC